MVDLERLTTPAQAIQNRNCFRLFALHAGFTSSVGLKNIDNPTQYNYAHTLTVGKITRSVERTLAKMQ
ncbi:MAG: hypothetical protein EA411_02555 [Saprospirales bacterium]|nr:MAG: hypothetical protein EA411_02555 [Saprospirales bacterium]